VCEDDTERIPVPVGEPCLWCEELIQAGDQGEELGYVGLGDPPYRQLRYAHVECVFRQVMGGPAHVKGTCRCEGGPDEPDQGMGRREAARWVWEYYNHLESFFR